MDPDRLFAEEPPEPVSGKAMKVIVRPGDAPVASGWRAEAIGPTETSRSGTRHYRWLTRLGEIYQTADIGTPNWQAVTQWHQQDGAEVVGNSPPIAIIIEDGALKLHLTEPDPNDKANSVDIARHVIGPATENVWHTFDLRVTWSLTGGAVALSHNGNAVATPGSDNIPTLFPIASSMTTPGSVYLKQGLYRAKNAKAIESVVFHDEMRSWSC